MSIRGVNFFNKWVTKHLPNAMTDGVAVSDLADELFKAAESEGIPAAEINEEVASVYAVIFKAMQHREGSMPENDCTAFDLLAGRLSREANITEMQAHELIERLGIDWETLLNEAHFLKELQGRLGKE
ncbi:hypothetical protein [Mesorhizobium humile]|uniref:DUF768 domain-containing protein n=1 Tax=Mesorhizobium humile TaxID=3072313 RepID=A0ABU4YGJ8_9HYPH|nr:MULTISPECIES: hypothetical protein [unclassified Mesorhizobium]MDX8457952.1 hypothetical protein [Mesorhizobium sp. VK2D]MDX8486055.1 hypothetical protein [Mesorhizobium sp. VK2B]